MSPRRDKSSPVLFEKARSRHQQVNCCLHKESLFGRNESRARAEDGDLAVLPAKKRGRRVLLGDDLDMKVQIYLKKVREGGVVSVRIAMAAARGIVLACDRSLLVEFGGNSANTGHTHCYIV